jgi:hypothetical protein
MSRTVKRHSYTLCPSHSKKINSLMNLMLTILRSEIFFKNACRILTICLIFKSFVRTVFGQTLLILCFMIIKTTITHVLPRAASYKRSHTVDNFIDNQPNVSCILQIFSRYQLQTWWAQRDCCIKATLFKNHQNNFSKLMSC